MFNLFHLLRRKAKFRRERIFLSDRLILEHFDKDGKLLHKWDSGWSKNGLTNAAFAEIAGLITSGVGGTAFGYIAIGTGTTAFAPTQTTLITEIKRKAATGSRVTTAVANDTQQLQTTFSSADTLSGTSAVTESGCFNASPGGTMGDRQVFAALNINWDAGDSLQVTWQVQCKQGS